MKKGKSTRIVTADAAGYAVIWDVKTGKKVTEKFSQPLSREFRANELLRRPEVTYHELMSIDELGPAVAQEAVAEQVEIQAKYHGYIERQGTEIARQQRHEETKLSENFDYSLVKGLSSEVCEKLNAAKPPTIGMASRIPGVTPAAISILLIHLKKASLVKKAA